MPYRKTLFSRIPILEQHSKPVTYFAVLKSMAWNTNNQVRFTFTMCGSKMRTALHTWLRYACVQSRTQSLRAFWSAGLALPHWPKTRRLWVQDWHMSISFPDSLCCFVQGKGQWSRWPKGSRPLGTILCKCLQLVLFLDRTALLCLSSDIFFGTMSKRKISSYFGSERGKTIDQEEEKNWKRIHTQGTIARRKWCSTFQMKWLNDHKWLRYKNNVIFCHFFLFFLGNRKTLYWIGEK